MLSSNGYTFCLQLQGDDDASTAKKQVVRFAEGHLAACASCASFQRAREEQAKQLLQKEEQMEDLQRAARETQASLEAYMAGLEEQLRSSERERPAQQAPAAEQRASNEPHEARVAGLETLLRASEQERQAQQARAAELKAYLAHAQRVASQMFPSKASEVRLLVGSLEERRADPDVARTAPSLAPAGAIVPSVFGTNNAKKRPAEALVAPSAAGAAASTFEECAACGEIARAWCKTRGATSALGRDSGQAFCGIARQSGERWQSQQVTDVKPCIPTHDLSLDGCL
eukprot:jgi/Mesen1/8734/ME000052S08163